MLARLRNLHPASYIPTPGETVLARRSVINPWTEARVTRVRPASRGKLRINFVWTVDNPACLTPVKAGTKGNVLIDSAAWPWLVRRATE